MSTCRSGGRGAMAVISKKGWTQMPQLRFHVTRECWQRLTEFPYCEKGKRVFQSCCWALRGVTCQRSSGDRSRAKPWMGTLSENEQVVPTQRDESLCPWNLLLLLHPHLPLWRIKLKWLFPFSWWNSPILDYIQYWKREGVYIWSNKMYVFCASDCRLSINWLF